MRVEPAPPVVPEVGAAPVSDANLTLEVLPFAKLRAGGQTRRFQVVAHNLAPRGAARSCGTGCADSCSGCWDGSPRIARRGTHSPPALPFNLSIATLEDERSVQKIGAALNAHGIAAETLWLRNRGGPLCTQRRAQVERFITQCDKLGAGS